MGKKHILIVDDQKEILLLLSSALETLPYEFEISLTFSGEEALLEAIMNPVDLLISDIRLPGMDGFEVMENFKKNHPNCKIMLISGIQEETIKREIAQAGASAFFFKPIVLSDFLDTVERTLGLVETLLPDEITAFKEDESEETIPPPDLIISLRNQIKADAILLVDGTGEISCSAGTLTDDFRKINQNPEILTSLYTPITLAKTFKTSLGENCSVTKINKTYLILSTISSNYGLIIQTKKPPSENQIISIITTQMTLRKQLSKKTGELLKSKKEAEKQEEQLIPIDSKMESTLASKKIKTDTLETFWEDAVEESMHASDKESLSYEQAKTLGLTPK